MPKSSRKKKEKTADFTKAKLKLGKGKQLASNATDTSFKARSIALPKQSVSLVKGDSLPTTRRNLTLDELLVHMKHYSATVRKDALAGVKELLLGHPELIESSLTTLLNRCVTLISDEDAIVRKTLLSLLSWLLPSITPSKLVPHAPLLLLFTTSALSHIFPEIRVDAVRFLDVLMKVVPDIVVGNWFNTTLDATATNQAETSTSGGIPGGRRVLNGYLALLDIKVASSDSTLSELTSSLTLSANSKLIILRSFAEFLRLSVSNTERGKAAALNDTTNMSHTMWFLESSFTTLNASTAFRTSLQPTTAIDSTHRMLHQWHAAPSAIDDFDEDYLPSHSLAELDIDDGISTWSLRELDVAATASESKASAEDNVRFIAELCARTSPVLISTFLDCAPSVFSPSASRVSSSASVSLDMIATVGQITRLLYGYILPRINRLHDSGPATVKDLRTLLGYMATYFPFDGESLFGRDPPGEQTLQNLSLVYCELISMLLIASQVTKGVMTTGHFKERNPENEMERVGDYVIRSLHGSITSSQPLGKKLSGTAYASLLPTIWSLINSPQDTGAVIPPLAESNEMASASLASRVLDATLEHATQAGSLSTVKPLATEFVARLCLVLVDATFRGAQIIKIGTLFSRRLADWVLGVPRLLWELGTRDLIFTERLFLFLLRFFQRGKSFLQIEDQAELRSRMCPYLSIDHPVKGVVLGPYSRLPRELKRRFIEVIWVSSDSNNGPDELETRVMRIVAGTEEETYWRRLKLGQTRV